MLRKVTLKEGCSAPWSPTTRLPASHQSRGSLHDREALFPHPAVYHEDFALSPLPEGHRFPMPKDHLLYCELQKRGWAARTFRPVAPDVETLSLVRRQPLLCCVDFRRARPTSTDLMKT